MTPLDINELVGLPYEDGAFGPDSFNCWGLLYYVQQNYFKTNMPMAPIGDGDGCRLMFEQQLRTGAWTELEFPEHGCGALMRGGETPHVGIYLDFDGGGILHSLNEEGVIWTPLPRLRALQFGRTKYYRLNNGRKSSNSS